MTGRVADGGEEPGLRVERDGRVGWMTIDRPHRRNAIDRVTRIALRAAADELEADDEVRVVVLTGTGDSFCAGTDLKEVPEEQPPHPLAEPSEPIAAALGRISKPLIAAINGPAAGGGLELALAADLRIASTNARFSLPEVRVGSLAGSGGTQRLFVAVAPAIAWKMLLTGAPIDAVEALRSGLISDLVAPDELRGATQELAQAIAANAPLSLRAAKAAGRAGLEDRLATGLAFERALWALLATTDDRSEGRRAFREGRPPRFEGR
jgi:E-phenylitaconyl-CoA hydratase